uniref:SWIM-type domain-containing protein n=1 Tax=viral metagenome TaxID=1070528 RepID=A0A6M3LMC8_9ZZZZ
MVAQNSPKLYTTSRSRPGTVYQVRFEGDRWCCTCPGYGYRGTCRHVTALAAFRPTPGNGGDID